MSLLSVTINYIKLYSVIIINQIKKYKIRAKVIVFLVKINIINGAKNEYKLR